MANSLYLSLAVIYVAVCANLYFFYTQEQAARTDTGIASKSESDGNKSSMFLVALYVCAAPAVLWVVYLVIDEFFGGINEKFGENDFGGRPTNTRRADFPMPPPFPTGWFYVMSSWELKKGDIKHVSFMDTKIIVFRDKDGSPAVIDAYCPHLGVNLGVRARLVDNQVVCPFHGWQFSGDGKCSHIPGQSSIPAQAHSRAWPVVERNGIILVWFSRLNPDQPTWEFPVVPELNGANAWRVFGKSEHLVRTHISDIPENTADVAHLNSLHNLPCTPWPDFIERHINLNWQGEWRAGTEADNDKHCGYVPVKLDLHLFGSALRFMHTSIQILLIGPGVMLYNFETPIGSMKMWETITPEAALLQRVSLVIFSERKVLRWIAKWFFRGVAATLHQDLYLWNNKIYRFKPVYSRNDKYLRTFRTWYSQFYEASGESRLSVSAEEKYNSVLEAEQLDVPEPTSCKAMDSTLVW